MTDYLYTSGGFPTSPSSGDSLVINGLFYDWTGTAWKVRSTVSNRVEFIATASQATKTGLTYFVGSIDCYINGAKMLLGTDFTATNGTSVTFTPALDLDDEVQLIMGVNASVLAGTDGADGAAAITPTYADVASLPLSGNTAGSLAYVTATTGLYVWIGYGWFAIKIINATPTFTTSPNANYDLASDGTATVITLVAVDPEGQAITWGHQVTSGTLGATTITNVSNVFTITPSTALADAGTIVVSFTASDGVNISTANSTFLLALNVFLPPGTLVNSTLLSTSNLGAFSDGRGVFVSPNEQYLYTTKYSNDLVYMYTMSTAGDLNTLGSVVSMDLTTLYAKVGARITMFSFSGDGLHAYWVDGGNTYYYIRQGALSTAWDISTLTSASKSFTLGPFSATRYLSGFTGPNDTGDIYIVSHDNVTHKLTMSTLNDITTCSLIQTSTLPAFGDEYARIFDPTGNKVFGLDYTTGAISERVLSTVGDITTVGSNVSGVTITSGLNHNYVLGIGMAGDALYAGSLATNGLLKKFSLT